LKKLVYLLSAIVVIGIIVVAWKQTRPPALSPEQKRGLDSFLNKYLSDRGLTEEDIKPVVTTGDPAVPHLIKAIGKVQPSQPLIAVHSDVNMVDCLARIGTPKAIDGICKILKHEYPGYYGMDRMQAAAALVRLGAKHKASILREVVVEHKELVAGQRYPEMHGDEIFVLENALRMLEAGEGARDTTNFGPGPVLEYGFLKKGYESPFEKMEKAMEEANNP